MTSEQLTELVRGHPDAGEDVTQGSLGHVPRVNWHANRTAIGVSHEVVAALNTSDRESGALKGLDHLRPRYGWETARHNPAGYYGSGYAECHTEFVRYADLFEQKFQAFTKVGYRRFPRRPVPERGNARAECGRATPNAVFVLLDDVGHVNGASHGSQYSMFSMTSCLRQIGQYSGAPRQRAQSE
jgi:hypothetical protein